MAATESRSLELRAVAIGAWVLAFVATVLRVYARAGIMKAFTTDDWLMIVAMVRSCLFLHPPHMLMRETLTQHSLHSQSTPSPASLGLHGAQGATWPTCL